MFLVPSLPLPLSIEESHENRNVFIGVLSLGKIFGDHHQWLAGANPTLQEPTSSPLQSGRRFPKDDPTRDKSVNDLKGRRIPECGIRSRRTKWNYLEPLEVTTQSRRAIHIRLQCPEDSILK